MKLSSETFRVHPGAGVKLDDTATAIEPFCKSKKQYRHLLEEHVAELSSLQQLHYAPIATRCC